MRDIQNKTDASGDILSANAFNSNLINELQGLVESADYTLDPEAGPDTDIEMFKKAITHYSTAASFFSDSGSVNAYVLSRIGNMAPLDSYKDGAIVKFKAVSTNSGASTINIDSIGVVDLVGPGGEALNGGEIVADNYYVCRYVSANGNFELINNRVHFTTSTDTNDTYYREFANFTFVTGTNVVFLITAYNGDECDTALVHYKINKQGPKYIFTINILWRTGSAGSSLFNDDSFAMYRDGTLIRCYVQQNLLDSGSPIHYEITLFSSGGDAGGFSSFVWLDNLVASGTFTLSKGLTDRGQNVYTESYSGLGSGLTAALMEFDTAPADDLDGFGIFITATVDVNATGITAALFKAADFNYEEADASASSTAPCTALALETGTGTKMVLLQGTIRNDLWSWSAGQIFLSETAGAFTQTAPSASGTVVQCVGYAISATVMYFNPSMDYGVNA